jgi:putative ABC transport system substrate-binding protein
VEGQNIAIEYRFAEGRLERLPDLASELVRLKVDVIVATVAPVAVAAKNATGAIPIVMVAVADPVGLGLVASLARPGGNITGLSNVAVELGAKQLEILKEAVPKVSRVAVLWNPANHFHPLLLREAEVAARSLALQLRLVEVRGPEELDRAFATVTKERSGALLVLGDPLFFLHSAQIADLAARNRLPAMYGIREHVEAGGLMAYAAHSADLFRRTATYVDKILKGAKPAGLPVEQASQFELVVNLKAARALRLTIPDSVMVRAVHVIQ